MEEQKEQKKNKRIKRIYILKCKLPHVVTSFVFFVFGHHDYLALNSRRASGWRDYNNGSKHSNCIALTLSAMNAEWNYVHKEKGKLVDHQRR